MAPPRNNHILPSRAHLREDFEGASIAAAEVGRPYHEQPRGVARATDLVWILFRSEENSAPNARVMNLLVLRSQFLCHAFRQLRPSGWSDETIFDTLTQILPPDLAKRTVSRIWMWLWLNSRAWHAVCYLLRLPFDHCSNMSPRPASTAYASGAAPTQDAYAPLSSSSDKLRFEDSPLSPNASSRTAWVDPASLSNYGDVSKISGNVTPHMKQLILNTFMAYGAGDESCFGHAVAKSVKFIDMSISKCKEKHGRMNATTVAEVDVTKGMLNGAGMLHGGCIAFLIDNCCSTPLVALGLVQNVNGVGVTQAMNILFHSPAPGGSCLRIISTSVAMGGRIMSARCEIIEKQTGRIVASAYLNKMQPSMAKL